MFARRIEALSTHVVDEVAAPRGRPEVADCFIGDIAIEKVTFYVPRLLLRLTVFDRGAEENNLERPIKFSLDRARGAVDAET